MLVKNKSCTLSAPTGHIFLEPVPTHLHKDPEEASPQKSHNLYLERPQSN